MKKLLPLLLALLFAGVCVLPAAAEGGQVIYSGSAEAFIFGPGSEYSPTDLFPDFKSVMPGDLLTEHITLKNNAGNQSVVKFYLQAIEAGEDPDFLSQLQIGVRAAVAGQQTWLYDAPADAALLDAPAWLGTLYPGGQVDLTVTLTVPTTMGDEYQSRLGRVDWVFSVEEFPLAEEIGHGYWEHGSDVGKIVENIIPAEAVTELLVDGNVVPPEFYELYAGEDGSLILKLRPEYLDRLSISDHTISVRVSDGSLHDIYILTILEKGQRPPKTGDDSKLTLWIVLAAASLALMLPLLFFLRRKRPGED